MFGSPGASFAIEWKRRDGGRDERRRMVASWLSRGLSGYAQTELTRTACPEIAASAPSNAIDISRNIPYIVEAAKTERAGPCRNSWRGLSEGKIKD
jgi:hypothetical protein